MPFQNPFVRGMLGAQQIADQRTGNTIGQLGGLLSLQNQMQMAPIQREMARLQLDQARQGPQPKWSVAERFNPQTGMREKVLVDMNNPSNVMPFGGQEARKKDVLPSGVVADLYGATPGERLDVTSPYQQFQMGPQFDWRRQIDTANIANTAAGLNMRGAELGYNTGITGMGAGFSPAQLQAVTPPPMGAPQPAGPRTPTPASFPRVSPQEQGSRDAQAGAIRVAESGPDGVAESIAALETALKNPNLQPTARKIIETELNLLRGGAQRPPQPQGPQTFVPPGTTLPGARPQPGAAPVLPPRLQAEQAVKTAEKNADLEKTVKTYVAARDGLISGLSGTETGPFVGRIPAVTEGQQIGEGAVAALAPVLKQIFRVAGEGNFTDRDQEILLAMVPTRADHPAARKAKLENIDRIISAKLGMPIPKLPEDGLEFNGFRFPSQEALNAYKKAAGIQ